MRAASTLAYRGGRVLSGLTIDRRVGNLGLPGPPSARSTLGSSPISASWQTLWRTVWSTPFGIGLAVARNTHSKVVAALAPLSGLALGVLIHGLHNASFLWASLQRSDGGPAVAVSLAIYGFSYIAWLVVAFKVARRQKVELMLSSDEGGSSSQSLRVVTNLSIGGAASCGARVTNS